MSNVSQKCSRSPKTSYLLVDDLVPVGFDFGLGDILKRFAVKNYKIERG